MTIQHKESGCKGIFFINEEDKIAAELTYSVIQENKMIIEHTRVDEELQGGNIGYELVQKAADHARTHRYTVIPLCQFAKAVVEKKPEFKDVLDQGTKDC